MFWRPPFKRAAGASWARKQFPARKYIYGISTSTLMLSNGERRKGHKLVAELQGCLVSPVGNSCRIIFVAGGDLRTRRTVQLVISHHVNTLRAGKVQSPMKRACTSFYNIQDRSVGLSFHDDRGILVKFHNLGSGCQCREILVLPRRECLHLGKERHFARQFAFKLFEHNPSPCSQVYSYQLGPFKSHCMSKNKMLAVFEE